MPTDRPGDVRLPFDPGGKAGDARIVFIGTVETPWATLADCPRNLRIARERGLPARLHLAPPYRPGLLGLEAVSHVLVLYWMHHARRDLIRQQPRHVDSSRGIFSLRSPNRPNPISVAVARILGIDAAAGIVEIDAIDCLDGTPLVDLKPYYASTDSMPDATAS